MEKNLIHYIVDTVDGNKIGQNFLALLDGSEALLIDAGYKPQCSKVLDDLKNRGVRVVKVLPSHYHPDHVEGILVLDSPTVYGNKHAIETLKNFYEGNELEAMTPDVLLDNDSILEFGDFQLSFRNAPGHSDCSMLININDKYLHIGDLYLRMNNGDEILPYVTWENVSKHIESLNKVLEYTDKTFLLSHGLCPISFEELSVGVKDRKLYLQSLLDSSNTISVEDATKNCSKPFLFQKWRDFVK